MRRGITHKCWECGFKTWNLGCFIDHLAREKHHEIERRVRCFSGGLMVSIPYNRVSQVKFAIGNEQERPISRKQAAELIIKTRQALRRLHAEREANA